MSIKYEIQSINNSQGTGEQRHFARIFNHQPMTAEQLKSRIQDSCSLTKGDIEATLSALREQMIRELAQGNRFYIPSIGYFSLSADLDMPENQPIDKVRGDYISVRNIKFRPDAAMLQEVKSYVRFERATFSSVSNRYTEEELLAKLTQHLSTTTCINRRDMERLFALRQKAAQKWLKHFTEIGVLRKEGARNSPVYLLTQQPSTTTADID